MAQATPAEVSSQTKPRVALISFPWRSYVPYSFLSDLLTILEPICDGIVFINGNTERVDTSRFHNVIARDIGISMHYLKDLKPVYYSAVLSIVKWFVIQWRTSLELIKARAHVDIVVFYVAYPGYILPLIATKLLRKKSVGIITHSKATTMQARIWGLQDPLLFKLLDGISPESSAVIKDLSLEKYGEKLLPEGARFIDEGVYRNKKKLSERANVVGFIGRMMREKGIVDFIRAVPLAAKDASGLKFVIVGSGPMSEWVKEQCSRLSAEQGIDVTFADWVWSDLADYYNELRLCVVPTHQDALPTRVLEAMACGTPVLATSIGAIPDVIKDEQTGFLLRSTAPEYMARRITTILNYEGLEEVADHAERLVKQKFSKRAAAERYSNILKETL